MIKALDFLNGCEKSGLYKNFNARYSDLKIHITWGDDALIMNEIIIDAADLDGADPGPNVHLYCRNEPCIHTLKKYYDLDGTLKISQQDQNSVTLPICDIGTNARITEQLDAFLHNGNIPNDPDNLAFTLTQRQANGGLFITAMSNTIERPGSEDSFSFGFGIKKSGGGINLNKPQFLLQWAERHVIDGKQPDTPRVYLSDNTELMLKAWFNDIAPKDCDLVDAQPICIYHFVGIANIDSGHVDQARARGLVLRIVFSDGGVFRASIPSSEVTAVVNG